MCAVGCLQTVINSRPTMKEKKAEKKGKRVKSAFKFYFTKQYNI